MENSVLFTFNDYIDVAKACLPISNLKIGTFQIKRFANEELYIQLGTKVDGAECFVLGSLAPPDTQLFSFFLLCHTLKKEGASKITAILPYLAYSRHDKNEPLKSYTTAFIAEISKLSIDEIITFDIHSQNAMQLFSMPVKSLSPATAFGKIIKLMKLKNVMMVAPDKGAVERCKEVAKEAEIEGNIAYLIKERTIDGVVHTKLHGTIKKQAIIIDDILDTGGTLISCCQKLLEAGVEEINIMVTHALFTGEKWRQLWELAVKNIYCTDTISLSEEIKHPNIRIISIIPYLREAIIASKN